MLCILQYLDYVNVMAYDVYWTGYDFSMDIEALLALGIPKERNFLLVTHWSKIRILVQKFIFL